MSQKSYEMTVEVRERVGKGAARAIRRTEKVPAVIYGDKKPPLTVALPYKEVFQHIHLGGFKTTIATLNLGDETIQVLPKDYQLDPIQGRVMHVDFLRVSRSTVVTVNIPVHFLNEEKSPGLKRGGVLNVVRHEIEFTCPAAAIPDFIEVDLTGLDLGDSIHISAVNLPEGLVPTIGDRNFTIATIAAPAELKAEEEGVKSEEPEVSAQKNET